jgi:MTH538 TIR-like domain (DUF1863)
MSFDYDHDEDLRNLLAGQAKHPDSPFEFVDWSVRSRIAGDWKEKVRSRIRRVDCVIVICGEHTDAAVGVHQELRIAQEEGKPYFLLRGHAGRVCTRPRSARRSDRLYPWTWNHLKRVLKPIR